MPPRDILLTYPNNIINTPIEVHLQALQARGHRVSLLAYAPEGPLQAYYRQLGFAAYSYPLPAGVRRHLAAAWVLRQHLRRHPAHVVAPHQQPCVFWAVLARQFGWLGAARLVGFRHHAKAYHLIPPDLPYQVPAGERFMDWVINRYAPIQVAPGHGVANLMRQAGVPEARIHVLPYQYRFDDMERKVDPALVARLRAEYPAQLRIITASRFVPLKQHAKSVRVLQQLRQQGIDAKLILPDHGPLLEAVQQLVAQAGLTDHVQFVGFTRDILSYVASCDVLLHPSLEDASSSMVKEAGLLGLPVVVVQGVGDFDDYVQDGVTGWSVPAHNFVAEAVERLATHVTDHAPARAMGQRLRKVVLDRFQLNDAVIDQYEALLCS